MTNDDRVQYPPQDMVDSLMSTAQIVDNLMARINVITDDHADRYADAIHDAILGRL